MGCSIEKAPSCDDTGPPEVGRIYIDEYGDPIMVMLDGTGDLYVVDLSDGNMYDIYIDDGDQWKKPVSKLEDGARVILTNEDAESEEGED